MTATATDLSAVDPRQRLSGMTFFDNGNFTRFLTPTTRPCKNSAAQLIKREQPSCTACKAPSGEDTFPAADKKLKYKYAIY